MLDKTIQTAQGHVLYASIPPEKANAFNRQMWFEVGVADYVDQTNTIRVLVLRGEVALPARA